MKKKTKNAFKEKMMRETQFNKWELWSARKAVKECKTKAVLHLGDSYTSIECIEDEDEKKERYRVYNEYYMECLCELTSTVLARIVNFKNKLYLPRHMIDAIELEIARKVLSGEE